MSLPHPIVEEMTETPFFSCLKFDLEKGSGTPLGSLPCFLAVGRRKSAASLELESALEPLHRLLYGRPGITGERREALKNFKGFPPEALEQVKAKVGSLKKEKLRQVVKLLGIRQHVSCRVEEVAKGVTDFLMCPRDDGVIQLLNLTDQSTSLSAPRKARASAVRTSSASKDAHFPSEDQSMESKRKKIEPSERKELQVIHKDSVKVATFEKILKMSPEERKNLGAKALRLDLEVALRLPKGALKPFKDDIVETATLIIGLLSEAERRGVNGTHSEGESTSLLAEE